MNDVADCNNGVIHIVGGLNFQTVPVLNKANRKLIKQRQGITFDLSQVDGSDNAGVALLVSLASYGKTLGKKVSFRNLPKQLLELVEASRLKEILPITK